MNMQIYKDYKNKPALWWIGVWATAWWAVSGLYVLLLFWVSRQEYADISSSTASRGSWHDWGTAITNTYQANKYLEVLVITILAVWGIGAYIWLAELKNQHVSYKAAFRDLFFTIR